MNDYPAMSVYYGDLLYRSRARLFYAGLPIPPFNTLPEDEQVAYIEAAEIIAAKILNEAFDDTAQT